MFQSRFISTISQHLAVAGHQFSDSIGIFGLCSDMMLAANQALARAVGRQSCFPNRILNRIGVVVLKRRAYRLAITRSRHSTYL